MKRIFIVLMALLVAGIATNVYGAELSYDPGSISLEIAPGESADNSVLVKSSNQQSKKISVDMKGTVENGNLPPEWISGGSVNVSVYTGQATAPLTISVPEDAGAGTYYGVVLPTASAPDALGGGMGMGDMGMGGMGGAETVDVGSGVYVTVVVKGSCQGTPTFSDMKISPESISARSHKSVDVEITGNVSVPEGCALSGLSYTLEDEYGEVGTDGPVAVTVSGDGNFRITDSVKASRKGDDKDGRDYTITVKATDALGNEVSEGFIITVAHDNRGGKGSDAKANNGKAKGKDDNNGHSEGKADKADKGKGKDK